MSDSELACVYSALILHDAGVPITVSRYFCVQLRARYRQSDAYLAQSLVGLVLRRWYTPRALCLILCVWCSHVTISL